MRTNMLNKNDLANVILNALGNPLDKNGNPIGVTDQMLNYSDIIIKNLKTASVNNVSGSVTAQGLPSAPITNGSATNGTISGISASSWLSDMQSGFPNSNSAMLNQEATGSTTHLMTGKAGFDAGKITGTCMATPTNPGPLLNGAGTQGKISGLSGSAWDAAIGSLGPLGSNVYNAIVSYIQNNSDVQYLVNSISGNFSAGGGNLLAGTGVNGSIT